VRFNPRFEPWLAQGFFSPAQLLSLSPALFFRPVAEKIGATRFELATSRSRTVRSIQAELRPVNACSIDLSDLAASVNSIRSERGWQSGLVSGLGRGQERAVLAVFGRFS
jgi:hypothetical protein